MIIATRDTEPHLPKPEGLLRVHQIGDSISYGAGVYPFQNLPYHLTGFLNRAYPDAVIEVKPYGLRSGNMWDSWSRFEDTWRDGDCDGVFFQLCNNDAQFARQVPPNHRAVQDEWTQDGPIRQLVDRTFERMARFRDQHQFDLVVLFYTLMQSDRQIIDAVAEQCARLDIPFADVLTYLSEAGNTNEEQYRATEYDSHPSSFTHAQTARRLTTECLRQNWFPRLKAASGRDDQGEQVLEAGRAMLTAGVSESYVVDWANTVLEAKAQASKRGGTRETRQARQASIKAAQETVSSDWNAWTRRQWQKASAFAITERREDIYNRMNNMGAMLKSAAEIITALEMRPDLSLETLRQAVPEERNNPDLFGQETPGDEWNTAALRLSETAESLHKATSSFEAEPDAGATGGGLLKPADSGLPAIELSPELNWLRNLRPQIVRLIERAEGLNLDGVPMTELGVPGAWLWNFLMHIRNREIVLNGIFESSIVVDETPMKPWTFVDVHIAVEGAAADKAARNYVTLQANYDVPRRWAVQDGHTVGLRHENWVARYAVPPFFAGDLEVFIVKQGNQQGAAATVSKVEIYNESEAGQTRISSSFEAREPDAIRVHLRRFVVGAKDRPRVEQWLSE